MPAYISHAIMGSQVYQESLRSNLFKSDVDFNSFKTYTLGADLATLSKKTIYDPHNYNTQLFFLKMCKYIKDNKLRENPVILSILYGHIVHYFFDVNAHPFIFYIDKGCNKVGLMSNHDLIEGYISSFLAQKVLNVDIMSLNGKYFNQADFKDTKSKDLLSSIYGEIYKDFNIMKSYNKVISTFSLIEGVSKDNCVFNKKLLIQIAQFNEFMKKNKLDYDELINKNNDIWRNPVTGEVHNESLMELYKRSIEMSLSAIKDVNDYLYNKKFLSELESTFTDLSYDTGVKCSLGKQMLYTRKKVD